ncbi:MAG: hypothetical protein JO362_13775 [Streptomycetaceae bacterium]|nr:hypothetical protein [Streptomycetaceae bacterium]
MTAAACERIRHALAAFACERQELAAGLARFAGQPSPGSAAVALLDRCLTRVAEEPELPNWLELARVWRWFGRIDPHGDPEILTKPAQAALFAVRRDVAELDDESLRAAALDLAPRSWLLEALADAVHAHAPDRDAPVDPTEPMDEHRRRTEARRRFLTTAAEHELQAVTCDPSRACGPAARSALICALVWRLPALTAVFAHVVDEPAVPRLAWQQTGPGNWRATERLPGAVAPLSAEVTRCPTRPQREAGLPLAVEGPYNWSVTWDAPDAGEAIRLEAGRASGRGYAQWQAEQFVDRLRRTPGGARHNGRLLIPVDPDATDPAMPARTLGLAEVLHAVIDRFEADLANPPVPLSPPCVSLPHSQEQEPRSAAAMILTDLDAPVPAGSEPANHAGVDEPAFTAFLAAHAVVLTTTARAYLAGLADSGPGPDTIAHRHQAAMRSLAALLQTNSRATALAESEIGPPPSSGYQALLDPDRLMDHLRFHAPREDRPQDLTPQQLAAVRQEICEGLAAVAVARMREVLARPSGGHDHIEDAVRDVVQRMLTYPDPHASTGEIGSGDYHLPDLPIRFTVSFHTTDNPAEADLLYSPADPRPAHLRLPVSADWSHQVIAAEATLGGRPVTEVLHRDEAGRPHVARIVEIDTIPTWPDQPGDRVQWHLTADTRIVNIDWTGTRPRLFTPEPAADR